MTKYKKGKCLRDDCPTDKLWSRGLCITHFILNLKKIMREITLILDEKYRHQDICDRNPDKICSCVIGIVENKLKDFVDQILKLFEKEKICKNNK